MKELQKIQSELRAPKTRKHPVFKTNYRNAEDILTAVKPLLTKYECALIIADQVEHLGDQLMIRSETLIRNKDGGEVGTVAYAGIAKKGDPQSYGAASSYARKYALNGLLAIDDGSDDPETTSKAPTATKESTEAAISSATTKKELSSLRSDITKFGLSDQANAKAKTL